MLGLVGATRAVLLLVVAILAVVMVPTGSAHEEPACTESYPDGGLTVNPEACYKLFWTPLALPDGSSS